MSSASSRGRTVVRQAPLTVPRHRHPDAAQHRLHRRLLAGPRGTRPPAPPPRRHRRPADAPDDERRMRLRTVRGRHCTRRASRRVKEHAGRVEYAAACRGGCSSAGRAPDCGSGRRGFKSHHPPQSTISLWNHAGIDRDGGRPHAQDDHCRSGGDLRRPVRRTRQEDGGPGQAARIPARQGAFERGAPPLRAAIASGGGPRTRGFELPGRRPGTGTQPRQPARRGTPQPGGGRGPGVHGDLRGAAGVRGRGPRRVDGAPAGGGGDGRRRRRHGADAARAARHLARGGTRSAGRGPADGGLLPEGRRRSPGGRRGPVPDRRQPGLAAGTRRRGSGHERGRDAGVSGDVARTARHVGHPRAGR